MKEFKFTVDDESFTTTAHELSANDIIKIASLDPQNYYLVEIHGHDQVSYKDRATDTIHIHEKSKFISVYDGETPVS